jgi:thiol-disulfide isomerase/thioredoxin
MIVIHINSSKGDPEELNNHIKNGKHVFVLFYMEGCGPCNATRPEWKKLENILINESDDIVIADVDQELLSKIDGLKTQPSGFPTMRYIKGDVSEDYEDSSIDKKDRSVDSFVKWIQSKTSQQVLYAIFAGINTISLGILGTLVTIATDLSLFLILSVGLFLVDPLMALGTFIIFGFTA